MRREKNICLKNIKEIEEFVNEAERCRYPIHVTYKDENINAKSFLAMVSMTIGKEVTVQYEAADAALYETLNKYCI